MLRVFFAFLKLGCTSFGGPAAHIGYFRAEFVERRKWLNEASFADLVALCNFLPGPISTQIGMAVGISQAGIRGALAAWLGFSLPSAILMLAFAYGFRELGSAASAGWLHGLKLAAVAIVAQAVWRMGRALCPDPLRATVAVGAALLVSFWATGVAQLAVIALGALIGWRLLEASAPQSTGDLRFPIGRRAAMFAWILFLALLVVLPVATRATGNHAVALVDSFYRTGALVFGGGHVVLPLIRSAVVPPGWISDGVFLEGYGAAQAVPGPLFTFAAYLGAVMSPQPNGVLGGLLCVAAISLPSFLLLIGALPYWNALRNKAAVQSALKGVNASVVGILLAALYNPVWSSSIHDSRDFALALASFALLMFWKLSPVYVVLLAAAAGAAVAVA
ncbi:MAG: chromate efflux transporter [Burkholderiales bacterium]